MVLHMGFVDRKKERTNINSLSLKKNSKLCDKINKWLKKTTGEGEIPFVSH